MDDGKTMDAKVIGTDPKTDLALLKVNEKGDYPFVSFAKEEPKIGDWVVAIGNPYGLGGTVTAGIVSAEGRDIGAGPYDSFLQIDAPINKGNSGGPTFNLQGRGRWREHGDILAIGRQRRASASIFRPAQSITSSILSNMADRLARLPRRDDPAGQSGYRRQARAQDGRTARLSIRRSPERPPRKPV